MEGGLNAYQSILSANNDLRLGTMSIIGKRDYVVGANFSLIHKSDADLLKTMKKNLVWGPSIVFTRYHDRSQTITLQHKKRQTLSKNPMPMPSVKILVSYETQVRRIVNPKRRKTVKTRYRRNDCLILKRLHMK